MTETDRMKCPGCGAVMNHHADKLDYNAPEDEASEPGSEIIIEAHTCPACGRTATRTATQ